MWGQKDWSLTIGSTPKSIDLGDSELELTSAALVSGEKAVVKVAHADGPQFALARLPTIKSLPIDTIRAKFSGRVTFVSIGGKVMLSGLRIKQDMSDEEEEEEEEEEESEEEEEAPPPASKGSKRPNEASASSSSAPSKKAKTGAEAKAKAQPNIKANTVEFGDAAPKAKAKAKADPGKPQVGGKFQMRSGLIYEVLKLGKGPAASRGRNVQVRYDGHLAKNGKRFDKGVIKFTLGKGEVIRGWDEGVNGMVRGEKRRLLIPSGLGYGARGAPPTIPKNADLIFEVELLNC